MNVTCNPIDIVDGERYGQAVFQGWELPYMIDEELDSFDTFEEKRCFIFSRWELYPGIRLLLKVFLIF
jgi:hypothetical protein